MAGDRNFIQVYQAPIRSMLEQIKPIGTVHKLFERALRTGVSMNLGERLSAENLGSAYREECKIDLMVSG